MSESESNGRRAILLKRWDEGRTFVATEVEEQEMRHEVKRRLGVLISADVRPIDVVNRRDILKGLDFSPMSAQCMKQIVNIICAAIHMNDGHPTSFSGAEEVRGKEIAFFGACSRRNQPPNTIIGRNSSKAPSERCACKFGFILFRDGTLRIKLHGDSQGTSQRHHERCLPQTEVQKANHSHLQAQLMSPTKEAKTVAKVAEMIHNDGTLKWGQRRALINNDVKKELPGGFYPCKSFLARLDFKAVLQAAGNISVQNELQELLKLLDTDDRFISSCLYLQHHSEEFDDTKTYAAVSWIDKETLPDPDTTIEVLTSDVTFGLTAPDTGFDKFDMITALTPGRRTFPIVQSVIRHEDSRTFEHNLHLLLKWKPSLKTDTFVFLIDGDPAKILAAKRVFKNVVIILCLYHLTENMKKRGKMFGEVGLQEGLECVHVCNCRNCGCEIPVMPDFDLMDALTVKCNICKSQQLEEAIGSEAVGSQTEQPPEPVPNNAAKDVSQPSWFSLGSRALAAVTAVATAVFPFARSSSTASNDESRAVSGALTSDASWSTCWKALRNAPTLPECKRLLDLIALHHPKLKDYMNFMWRNVGLWAKCTFVWKLTLGYEATTLQEGMFSSIKRRNTSLFIPLHQLPDHIRSVVHNRTRNIIRQNESLSSKFKKSALEQDMDLCGCEMLRTMAYKYLTDEGYNIILNQFRLASSYRIEQLHVAQGVSSEGSIMAAKALLEDVIIPRQKYATSAMAFLCLLELEQEDKDLKLFKVSALGGNETAVDLVAISSNGSVACTDPFFAQWGLPCKKILGVHKFQYCSINVLLHCHPMYHRETVIGDESRLVANLTVGEIMSLTATTPETMNGYRAPRVSVLTSWQWAQARVTARSIDVIFGGEPWADHAQRRVQDIGNSPTSKSDCRKKLLYRFRNLPQKEQARLLKQLEFSDHGKNKRTAADISFEHNGEMIRQTPINKPRRKKKRIRSPTEQPKKKQRKR